MTKRRPPCQGGPGAERSYPRSIHLPALRVVQARYDTRALPHPPTSRLGRATARVRVRAWHRILKAVEARQDAAYDHLVDIEGRGR